ncbi:MAG: glycosyltransferase family 4 protein [Thaumarchaeota archaeon]|nr:glycosyltransferase family 4 protein [Nitrososphaerota archaeon]
MRGSSSRKPTVFIGTFPSSSSTGNVTLLKFLRIIDPLINTAYIVVGDLSFIRGFDKKYKPILLSYHLRNSFFARMFEYLRMQVILSIKLMETISKVDLVIFFLDGTTLVLPILAAKIFGKKVITCITGLTYKSVKTQYGTVGIAIAKMFLAIEVLTLLFADRIATESFAVLDSYPLPAIVRAKTRKAFLFVEMNALDIRKPIFIRENLIGYIGRLSAEKGVLNFIEAIPLVLKKKADTYFIICGQGNLAREAGKIIEAKGLEANVKLTGWIPHEDVPRYLNELKLLVLPSFTEGLPNILLEAMACGTPVLATPVGAIPDIIKDSETGFLLKSNDPKQIAERIVELLNRPELLEMVGINAYNYIKKNFSYEKALEAWRRVLMSVNQN